MIVLLARRELSADRHLLGAQCQHAWHPTRAVGLNRSDLAEADDVELQMRSRHARDPAQNAAGADEIGDEAIDRKP